MDFDAMGEMALGSRLREMSIRLTHEAEKIYEGYQIPVKPKWFPVFYFLSKEKQGKAITAIANAVGHSHPSVIKIVKEMAEAHLVLETRDASDGRINKICLTVKGRATAKKIENQYADVGQAVRKTLEKTQHNLWLALQEMEFLLQRKSMYERVMTEKKARESAEITIMDYRPEHHHAFRNLNEQWITEYFKMEDADREALNHPKDYILDKVGIY